jgi:hypothetical protein
MQINRDLFLDRFARFRLGSVRILFRSVRITARIGSHRVRFGSLVVRMDLLICNGLFASFARFPISGFFPKLNGTSGTTRTTGENRPEMKVPALEGKADAPGFPGSGLAF